MFRACILLKMSTWADYVNYTLQKAWKALHFIMRTLKMGNNNMKPFYYQLMHIMLKNTELLKHSKITLQHVSVYVETIFRELQSVLG